MTARQLRLAVAALLLLLPQPAAAAAAQRADLPAAAAVDCTPDGAAATDRFVDFADLAAHERAGIDYRVTTRPGVGRGARVAQLAIHGGGIEPPTTQLADYSARVIGSGFYSLAGLKDGDEHDLHVTATHFDDPRALSLVEAAAYTVSWHGAAGSAALTYVGGLDTDLAQRVAAALRARGFPVAAGNPGALAGVQPCNIANRDQRGRGVQLEISEGQRRRFLADGDLGNDRIDDPRFRTPAFYAYTAAVLGALTSTLSAPRRTAEPFSGPARP
ncbi:poly-gamma-glutamate hydrolase family protein [Kitasatospora kifunensis]|uniref:Phage replication-related protein YjqB (UPF0714/DUF867 family) n=1 Tax=Kitasatospora kifunensis TaxID=58351 RepID=A0A7W7R9C6_KITKI|nr:poly-gamma-glutamate hydrolase family protein [Kitasatospora kifunensis]MBB4927857.1 phage replication-related protein YjqB (UPF0714/DUF867 family) [Kitasatospora kifunensis]